MGDNYGELAGNLHELKKFWKRNGNFQLYFSHRAVALPNGKTAVDCFTTVHYIENPSIDPRDEDNRCPPTPERAMNNEISDSRPKNFTDSYMLSKMHVSKENNRLAESIAFTIKDSTFGPDLIDRACGDGSMLLALLEELATQASGVDISLVITNFENFVSAGVSGELSLESMATFIKLYKRHKARLPEELRPPPSVEVQTISKIAHRAPQRARNLRTQARNCATDEPRQGRRAPQQGSTRAPLRRKDRLRSRQGACCAQFAPRILALK